MEYRCVICNSIIKDSAVQRNLKRGRPIKYCSIKCSANDPELKERRKQTVLKKYGCTSVLQNKEVMAKKIQTSIDRYGEDYAIKVRAKGSKTNLERYGTTNPINISENRTSNYRSHFYESFKQLLKDRCIELLDDYQTYLTAKVFHYKCMNCGKVWESEFHDAYHMKQCSCCKNVIEAQVLNYIKSIVDADVEFQQNVRNLIGRKYEIDIYIPSLKAGFEVDGTYYHSEIRRGKTCQQTKSLLCFNHNISLMHVYEYFWNNDRYNVKAKIKQFIEDVTNHNTKPNLDLDCFVAPDCKFELVNITEPQPIVEVGKDIVYNSGTVILKEK